MSGFVVYDYIVFCLTILVSLAIGVYHAYAGQKTTSDFLVGGRQMKVLPVAVSLMVSFESSIMMLGYPAETYVYGMMFWLSTIGFLVSCLLATRMVVPLVHPLKITSVNEYYELRYNSRYVRLLNLTIGCINYILYMGIVLFGPGIALESVTNFPMWTSVLVVAVAAVIYTSIGGIKAVIWTDVFQSVVMFMGIFAILIKGTMVAGGISKVVESNKDSGRLDMFDFDPDPTIRHTFWSLVVGGCIRMVGLNIGQTTIQRIVSTPTQRDAIRVLYLAGPAFFITLTLATLEGAVAYGYFTTLGCDPLKSKQISNPNQHSFVRTQQFVCTSHRRCGETKLQVIVGKNDHIDSEDLRVLAAFGGPASGLFLFSVFCPWGNAKGAIIGTLLTAVVGMWISTGQNFSTTLKRAPGLPPGPIDRCIDVFPNKLSNMTEQTTPWTAFYHSTVESSTEYETKSLHKPKGLDRFYSLSYQWLTGFLIIVSLILCSAASIISGRPDPASVDVRYMLPFFDQFFPFLPKNIRKRLYGGVPFEKVSYSVTVF
uniref:Sodium-dependent multivitamin transporter n=1 Tax=Magallana gigas TaxID=29159 RepID=K1RV70_MAGGI